MKIICLSTRCEIGGAQLNALLLAQMLRVRGHQAEAWFLMKTGELAHGDTPVVVFSDRVPRGLTEWLRLLNDFFRMLRQTRPAAIIGFQPLANVFGALAAARHTVTFIGTQRNPAHSQTRPLAWIEAVLSSTRLCSANIAVSRSVVSSFRKYPHWFKQKMAVVYNGLPPLPEITDSRESCRRRWGLPLDAPIVGTIGRLDDQKNPEFLLELVRRLPQDIHLVMAGTGPLQSKLVRMAGAFGLSARVHFVGALEGVDVPRLYRALDIFLFPTRYEGFGRVILECFSMSVPVIASDLEITREVADDAAILLPLNVDAWVLAVTDLLRDSAKRADQVRRGRARASKFSLDAMVEGYLSHLSLGDRR